MAWYQYVIYALIVIALAMSVIYSVRYRTQKDPQLRFQYNARMNIAMGCLLLAVALGQAASYEMSSLRLVIAVMFVLVGLFNLFAGLRNLSLAKRGPKG